MLHTIFIDNDNILEVTILNSVTNQSIDDATVQVTVYDEDEAPVTGQAWPTTMTYAPGSAGVYRAALKAEIPFVRADKYTAVISIETIDSITAKKTCRMVAAESDCQTATVCP